RGVRWGDARMFVARRPGRVARNGAHRRHPSPPPAVRTRGTGPAPVPIPSNFVPASVAPAGAELVEGRRVKPPPLAFLGPAFSLRPDARTLLDSAAMISAVQHGSSARDIAYPRDGGFVMRLLIIEDDRDAADYLAKAFREVGHVADLAADGEEGLAHALDGQYDVLFVDRMLPKL